MIEEIISSGFCPKQNKEYSVLVRYDGNVRILCECKYSGFNECDQSPCPLLAKFPENR